MGWLANSNKNKQRYTSIHEATFYQLPCARLRMLRIIYLIRQPPLSRNNARSFLCVAGLVFLLLGWTQHSSGYFLENGVLPQSTVGFVPIPDDNWLRCYSLQLNPGKISSPFKKTMKTLRSPNKDCQFLGQTAPETIIRFGFYRTRRGKRRRYRCQTCEKTFCSNTGTPYYRLQHRRAKFDQVATLSVEGLNKSAIARVEQRD